MAKRSAGVYLTDQNWDQEDDSEEAGVFAQAGQDVMQRRQVKKAKRRTDPMEEAGTGSSAFKGFAGFGVAKAAGTSATTANFSFAPEVAMAVGSLTNGSSGTSTSTESSSSTSMLPTVPPLSNGTGKASNARSKYLHQLKSLNEGVSRWIKEHVDKNAYCLLTPIFKDYEKHLAEIEKKYPYKEESESSEKDSHNHEKSDEEKTKDKPTTSPNTTPEATATMSGFTFATAASTATSKGTDSSSFGVSSTAATIKTTEGATPFAFGSTAAGTTFGSSSTLGSGIFGGSSSVGTGSGTFSFAVAKPKDSETKEAETAEEEYTPPEPEVADVKEDDALYTKRCKLFYKSEDKWLDRGIGNLHLKPCNGKTQLLIRADTSLGNILLNIMLSESMPMNRQGKNNVTVVCIPNPPMEKKMTEKAMVPLLIRVKTADDADELLAKLKEYSSSSS